MTQTREQRLMDVHERAMTRFDDIQNVQRDERRQCIEDRRFYSIAGAMWEGNLGAQFENLPKFEFNKIHLSVIRIFNEYRNNRIGVSFRPKTGVDDRGLADALSGLYRADEQDSNAQEAYDNAFEEGVGGGIGAWRLRAAYEDDLDEDDDRQRVCIEPIFDADTSVYFDLSAKRQDKKDARHAFVISSYTMEAFCDEWPDASPADWPKETRGYDFDWCNGENVFVAEYYEIEDKSELIHVFRGLDGQEQKVNDADLEEKQEELQATGFREVRQKRVKRPKVHKYLLSGGGVLEDSGYIAGRYIPIVPFFGKRWFVDNIERCMGHVRLAKDATRLKNMQISQLALISSLSPIQKPIFLPEQMAGHAQRWADDNIKQYPYQLINPIADAGGNKLPQGPVGYTQPPTVPASLAALLQITEADMQDLLGNQQAGEQLNANVSAKAVELVQNKLDMQCYIYMDNMSKAMKRCGEIWLSMARDLYVEEGREMKSVNEQGESESVKLMTPMIDEETAEQYFDNDVSGANMEVIVDVGPSFVSRRDGTVRAITGMMNLGGANIDPETSMVLQATAFMNMDGEGISDVQDWFRKKLLKIGAVKPTDEEAKQLAAQAQGQQPDPQAQYLQAAAEQATADAAAARAKTVETVASAGLKDAQKQKTLAEIPAMHNDAAIKAATAMHTISQPQAMPVVQQ